MTHGSWRQTAAAFDEGAAEYDQWYENSLVFATELRAIKELRTPLPGPALEVGVGPGRFAMALGTRFGLDPAMAPLRLAAGRRIIGSLGVGEHLPYRNGVFGTVYLLFTLCFAAEPLAVLRECRRVLRAGGHLVIGQVPASGPWGRFLGSKKAAGHPFYRHAIFYEVAETEAWAVQAGFVVTEKRSTLRQPPDQVSGPEASRAGVDAKAGLVLLVCRKTG